MLFGGCDFHEEKGTCPMLLKMGWQSSPGTRPPSFVQDQEIHPHSLFNRSLGLEGLGVLGL